MSDTKTVAWMETSIVLAGVAFELAERSQSGLRRYRQRTLSLGRHIRGKVGACPCPRSSVVPSGNSMSILLRLMLSLENGPVSISRDAMREVSPGRPFDREYRTRLEIAGSARKAFWEVGMIVLSLIAPLNARGAILDSRDVVSFGTAPCKVGSPLKDSNRLIDAGTPLGRKGS